MATLKDASLSATGSGAELIMAVDVEIDWDRGDDEVEWEIQIRFVGDDALMRGGNDTLLVHAVPAAPRDGERRRIEVSGAGGAFDEDRGRDEVFAEVQLLARTADVRVVKTNTVEGDFSG
ncbi:hypothetical protein [Euzebya sp.]|uniref:hypothetical protein n=1 Tax=Euzebya sp. TaxID=1971409 RepID=UPI0035146250